MSLRLQIDVETATCRAIVEVARAREIIGDALAKDLLRAIDEATASSREWIDDDPEYLGRKDGQSVYHDVARALHISADAARKKLEGALAGSDECAALEPILWQSGRRVDLARAKALSAVITGAHR